MNQSINPNAALTDEQYKRAAAALNRDSKAHDAHVENGSGNEGKLNLYKHVDDRGYRMRHELISMKLPNVIHSADQLIIDARNIESDILMALCVDNSNLEQAEEKLGDCGKVMIHKVSDAEEANRQDAANYLIEEWEKRWAERDGIPYKPTAEEKLIEKAQYGFKPFVSLTADGCIIRDIQDPKYGWGLAALRSVKEIPEKFKEMPLTIDREQRSQANGRGGRGGGRGEVRGEVRGGHRGNPGNWRGARGGNRGRDVHEGTRW